MVNFIKKHRFLVYTLVIIFTISAIITIFGDLRSLIWCFKLQEPDEEDTIDLLRSLGCNLIEKEDKDMIYEFNYYTEKESCDYIISFSKTYDSDVLSNDYDDFYLDDKYNKDSEVDNSWEFTGLWYEYYAELGKYYRTIVQENNTNLSIVSKSENKNKVDQIFKKLNLEYKYKNTIDFELDMFSLFWILVFFFWWQINVKFGRKGWTALIPIYNLICLSDDVFHDKGRAILCFIPIVNIVYFLSVLWNLGKYFRKGKNYCWLTMIFPCVFIPLLVFSDYKFAKNKE